MQNCTDLNAFQKKLLQRVMNLSFTSASSAISTIMGTDVLLHVPRTEVVHVSAAKEAINQQFTGHVNHTVMYQVFKGKLEGETIFIIDERSLYALVN